MASPVPVSLEASLKFTRITAGQNFTCGLAEGTGYCWGDNTHWQLGINSTQEKTTPQPIHGDLTLTTIKAGMNHVCALTLSQETHCWGANDDWQAGQPGGQEVRVPTRLDTPLKFSLLGTGVSNSCGVAADRKLYCWGSNRQHLLSPDGFLNTAQPQLVTSTFAF